jgi:predicted phage-related endonuclease
MSTVVEQVPQIFVPELPGCVVEIYDNMDQWLAARNSVIGASESASIFGVGYADESKLSIWGRKVGKLDGKEDTDSLECGRVLQPAIIELFRRRYLRANPECGARFNVNSLGEYTLCRSLKHSWLGASLDDYFVDNTGPAIVEAKNVSFFMSSEWDDDDPPLKFHVQTQQQMFVTGTERDFAVGLIGGNRLVWKEARRDERFINAMVSRLAEFQEMVDAGIEPPADATEATRKTLQKLHPKDNGVTVVASDEANQWHRDLLILTPKLKALEAEDKLLRNRLRQEIGDNTAIQLGDGSRYTYKHSDKQVYCCDICGHEKRSEPFRTLRYQKA